jgi:sarcosine oxidase, subunit beta
MPLALLKYGLHREHPDDPHFRWKSDLKKTYDLVIIGAGGHGLATAYYLAKNYGISNIAVLDKGWLAGGNTARNTTIVRANYLTPEGVAFYKESVNLFRTLSNELDINVMYSERGHFTLAHTDAAMRTARWRAEVNKHLGVNSEVIDGKDVKRLCPVMNVSESARYPVLGALYHPPGAIARHDAPSRGGTPKKR